MSKAILKDVVLAVIFIVFQVAVNMSKGAETNWLMVIGIGLLVGLLDFVISYMKGGLENMNNKPKSINKRGK